MPRDDWFVTASGRRVSVMSPDPEQITIDDIAHALAHICRFGGHTLKFYSVAQHSVFVSLAVPPEHALVGLLHDATEAYLGDMIRPLKGLIPRYRQIERLWWHAICAKFGLPDEPPPCVKAADLRALVTERRDLIQRHTWSWRVDEQGIEPDPMPLVAYEPRVARSEFVTRWEELRHAS